MEAFTQFEGTTLPLMNDNIDTDQILPKNYLKRVEKTGLANFYLTIGAICRNASLIQHLS